MADAPALASSEFQILLALLDGPMNGVAIKEEIAGRPSGRVLLGPGTLYTSIKRMLDEGLIGEHGIGASTRERIYRISARGRTAATGEARRLEQLVADARAKRLIGPAGAKGAV